MRSTSNPVRRLRRGDFQGNPGESGCSLSCQSNLNVSASPVKGLVQVLSGVHSAPSGHTCGATDPLLHASRAEIGLGKPVPTAYSSTSRGLTSDICAWYRSPKCTGTADSGGGHMA